MRRRREEAKVGEGIDRRDCIATDIRFGTAGRRAPVQRVFDARLSLGHISRCGGQQDRRQKQDSLHHLRHPSNQPPQPRRLRRRCGCGGNPSQFVRRGASLPLAMRADERRRVKAFRLELAAAKRQLGRGFAAGGASSLNYMPDRQQR